MVIRIMFCYLRSCTHPWFEFWNKKLSKPEHEEWIGVKRWEKSFLEALTFNLEHAQVWDQHSFAGQTTSGILDRKIFITSQSREPSLCRCDREAFFIMLALLWIYSFSDCIYYFNAEQDAGLRYQAWEVWPLLSWILLLPCMWWDLLVGY